MTRTTAIDIEATPRGDDPEFDEPAGEWETFAVALSQRTHAEAMPETAVFVRRDSTDLGLCKLLAATANWLADRAPHDCLVSYNGHSFDFPVLKSHIDEELEAHDPHVAEYVRQALDVKHRDLFAEIVDGQPDDVKWPSLSESLTERGLAKATPKIDDSDVTGADMPGFGDKILAGGGLSNRERRVLREYASSDVRPLHPLADELDRERQAAEEAREVL